MNYVVDELIGETEITTRVEEMAEEIAALVAAHNTSSLSDEEDFRGVHTMLEKRKGLWM